MHDTTGECDPLQMIAVQMGDLEIQGVKILLSIAGG